MFFPGLQVSTQVPHCFSLLPQKHKISFNLYLSGRHLVISTCAKPQVMCAVMSCIKPHSVVTEHWYSLRRTPAKPTYVYCFHLSKAMQARRASLSNFRFHQSRKLSTHGKLIGNIAEKWQKWSNDFLNIYSNMSISFHQRWDKSLCQAEKPAQFLGFFYAHSEVSKIISILYWLKLAAREKEREFLMAVLWEWCREYPP